jgi:hypothetical protein
MKKRGYVIFVLILFISLFLSLSGKGVEIDRDEDIINQMLSIKEQFSKEDFNTIRFEDIIQETKLAINEDDKAQINALIIRFEDLGELAYNTKMSLDTYNKTIDALEKIDISEDDKTKILGIYNEAVIEFRNENYEGANKLLLNTQNYIKNSTEFYFIELFSKINSFKNQVKEIGLSTKPIISLEQKILDIKSKIDLSNISLVRDELININESIYIIKKIQEQWLFVKNKSINQELFEEIFVETKYYFENSRFEKIKELGKRSSELSQNIVNLEQKFEYISDKISELKLKNLEVNDAEVLLNKAKENYYQGNFELAEIDVNKAISILEEIESENIIFGALDKSRISFDILAFIKNNYKIIILVMGVITLIFCYGYEPARDKVMMYRYKNLRSREKNIIKQIKKIQTEYYVKKSISTDEYNNHLDTYQNSLIDIRRKLYSISKKLKINNRKILIKEPE